MSGSVTAADDFNHVVCKYGLFTSVSATPPPPASGNQYGIARVNGRSGYTQAADSQGGSSSLGSGLFFRANDSVGVLIEYLMPPGWTTSC